MKLVLELMKIEVNGEAEAEYGMLVAVRVRFVVLRPQPRDILSLIPHPRHLGVSTPVQRQRLWHYIPLILAMMSRAIDIRAWRLGALGDRKFRVCQGRPMCGHSCIAPTDQVGYPGGWFQ